ncbi:LysR family transcriptional regulator [Rhizobium sp. FKY42]|uniref:LysR family transcriptional regulator n=1 Tax=Rhizobium sp. FKY42 TaxID=2562310 RepID=UPI0010BFB74F|nr:LysR family transcriptional regulator [Rhizobium sp. FKY42]
MDALLGLRVFALVAELRSFSAASERLGLSPAMTSKHVQHVEARVGARLLNRTSRSVSLTEAGTRYLATVRTLLEGLEQAEAELSQTTVSPKGTLKVSLPVWMANPIFAKLIVAFHEQYPTVTLDLDLSGRKVNLVDEGFDLALRVTPSLDEALIARRLTTIRFALVGTSELLDRLGRPKTVEEVHGKPLLAYSSFAADGRILMGNGQDTRELYLNPVVLSGNETLLHFIAREGLALAMMPHWLVQEDLATGRLEAIFPKSLWPAVTLHAVYPNRSYLPAKTRCFLDFLIEQEPFRNEPLSI